MRQRRITLRELTKNPVAAAALALVVLAVSLSTAATGAAAPAPELRVSSAATRAGDVALQDATLAGKVYIFVVPEEGVTKAQFWLDNPNMTTRPRKTESNAPWDFAGTATGGLALPFDTAALSDGLHSITAKLDLAGGGSQLLQAAFVVSNSVPSLSVSSSTVSMTVPPSGPPQSSSVQVGTSDGQPTQIQVSDDRTWLTATPSTESTPTTLIVTVDPTGLAPGAYRGIVAIASPGYASTSVTVDAFVSSSPGADQVHLGWTTDPSTSFRVMWRTFDGAAPSRLRYRASGTTDWLVGEGTSRISATMGREHQVGATALRPATGYDYQVATGAQTWSSTFTTRTAPGAGSPVDVVFVADTGIAGRADGLTTGTLQVVDEIAALDPMAVLGGGDYAYYNTETRFSSLDEAIDAWLNQMQQVASRSPLIPVYGNHEALLGENVDSWAARFPDPGGLGDRRNYSFDIGSLHVVGIHAVAETTGLSNAQLAWIEQDITAARAGGAKWIVPYMHVSAFSDGRNHPSNLALRSQLGPLFERLQIDLVISAHDQSYERTYPLVGVPNSITATSSNSSSCYSPADDGITWLKVGPGGKLSNKNGGFSQWLTEPPPAYTAARANSLHHFAHLRADEASLQVEVIGLKGNGTAPTVVDMLEYRVDACPQRLSLSPPSQTVTATAGGTPVTTTLELAAHPAATEFSVTADAPWATVTPATGTTPATVTVEVDPVDLLPGIHTLTVTALSTGSGTDTSQIRVDVLPREGHYQILLSLTPDRSAAVPLDGASRAGNLYIFAAPATNVGRVRFWLDDPNFTKKARKTESNAPFDFAGTATNGSALPFSTGSLSSGAHTISAVVDLASGERVVLHAVLIVP